MGWRDFLGQVEASINGSAEAREGLDLLLARPHLRAFLRAAAKSGAFKGEMPESLDGLLGAVVRARKLRAVRHQGVWRHSSPCEVSGVGCCWKCGREMSPEEVTGR